MLKLYINLFLTSLNLSLTGAYSRGRRRAAGEQAGVPCMEQGWAIGNQRRQQLFGSSVTTCDHCPLASSVLTAAGTKYCLFWESQHRVASFCSFSGKSDQPNWNISWIALKSLAVNWAAQYPLNSLSPDSNNSISNALCFLSPSFLYLASITTSQFMIVCSLTLFPIPYGTLASPSAVAPLCSCLPSSKSILRPFLLC